MKKARHFQFLYLISDARIPFEPPVQVCSLEVNAVVYQFPDGSLHRDPDDEKVTVDIDSVLYDGKSVGLLLETVAEDTFNNIVECARQHGADKFEINEAPEDTIGDLMASNSGEVVK